MNVKKILTILFLCLMTIQFNITSCSTGTGDDNGGENGTTSVNDPTNNYQVVAEVISIGGFGGCSIGAVNLNDETVEDADFRINNVIFASESGFYADTLFQLTFLPGTNYTLNVSHLGQEIATGTAKMPSTPTVTNVNDISFHNLNQSMNVTWQSIQNASSIQVTISGEGYDPITQDYFYREFESEAISPNSTSFTIPDTFFTYPGEYTLGIIAYHGINPGFNIDFIGESGYSKGHNMNGAAGVFIAASLSSEEGEEITVGSPPLLKANPNKVPAKSFKDYVMEKHKKYFGTKFRK